MARPPQAPPLSPARAEALVSVCLERQGWRILARNFRWVGTELDLVAQKGGTIVVVEVKQRDFAPESLAAMQQLLPWGKRQALVRGAQAFLGKTGATYETLRFDLAVVLPTQGDFARGDRARGEERKKEAGQRPASIRYYVNILA